MRPRFFVFVSLRAVVVHCRICDVGYGAGDAWYAVPRAVFLA